MPYFFIILGVILVVSAARDTYGNLLTLLEGDLVNTNGPQNFFYWFAAIAIIGLVGYIDELKPISNGFLALVLVVLFIDNKGFFAQFTAALSQIRNSSGNTVIPNASSAGVSVAVDTVPTGGSSSSTTVISGGGSGVIVGGGGSGTGGQTPNCPAGYTWLDSQCVPIDFGFGGGGSDPLGGDPFGDQGFSALTPLKGLA